jgi:MFS family permease
MSFLPRLGSRPRLGLLADHDFRQLFAATTVSQFGNQVTFLALPLVALEILAATAWEVGVLTSLATAAFLLVGLPAGAWVDRTRRRRVLIVADLGRAALLASVPVAWWTGVLSLEQLYVVALLVGVLTVFFDVAYQSYLPHLVGRSNLVEGNAKLESVRATAQVGGPALGGQLVQLLTAPVALLVEGVALALSAGFLVRVGRQEVKPPRESGTHLLKEIGEGLRFVLGHRLLRMIAACTATGNLFGAATMAMAVFFLRKDVGLSASMIGVVFAVGGCGAVVGALWARRFATWVGQGPAMWLSLGCCTPFGFLLPLSEPGWRVWLGTAGYAVMAAGIVIYNVTQVSFRQAITPNRLLGRMNATMRFLVWGTQPIGALVGGVLGSAFGARSALLIAAGGACLSIGPLLLSPLRTTRDLPTDQVEDATPLADAAMQAGAGNVLSSPSSPRPSR